MPDLRTILVVDDDAPMREMLLSLLQDEGYRVRAHTVLAQALRRTGRET